MRGRKSEAEEKTRGAFGAGEASFARLEEIFAEADGAIEASRDALYEACDASRSVEIVSGQIAHQLAREARAVALYATEGERRGPWYLVAQALDRAARAHDEAEEGLRAALHALRDAR